jgi:hypothetical protein
VTTTTTEIDEIRQRALDRAQRIVNAFVCTEPIEGIHTAPRALGAAFHAAADALRDEADAATERRKKGWQSYVKELQQVAARLVGIAQDLAELSKLDPEPSALIEATRDEVAAIHEANPVKMLKDALSDEAVEPPEGWYPGEHDAAQAQFFADRVPEPATRLDPPPPTYDTPPADGGERIADVFGVPREFVKPLQHYTAATDPVTSQADVVAYLKGDTDEMSDLSPGPMRTQLSIVPGDKVEIQAGDEWTDVTHQANREAAMTLRFEDPLPPAEAFGPKLPPGVDASARRTYADLMKPVDPKLFPEHWSWSQLTSSEDCGLQQRLGRLEGVKEIPQWSNVGGSTFHAVSEQFDRGAWQAGGADLLAEAHPELITKRWNDALDAAILAETATSGIEPGEEGEHWRAADRGKENLTWWRVEGERMLAGYIRMRRTLDKRAREAGTLAQVLMLSDRRENITAPVIEWEYTRPQPTPAGMLMVKGVIDRAYRCSDGSIMIKDLKTSRRVDGTSTGQLGEYAQAILHLLGWNQHDRHPDGPGITIRGCFYDARREIFTEPVDLLAKHPADEYAYRYGAAEAHRRLGVAQPHRSNFCVSCSVAYACPVGGA